MSRWRTTFPALLMLVAIFVGVLALSGQAFAQAAAAGADGAAAAEGSKSLLQYLKYLHSAEGITEIITKLGPPVLIAIIFAETGLLVGFFLPGDSLLITAGILANPAAAHHVETLSIWPLYFLLLAAGIIGDQVGFFLGTRVGNAIWDKPDGRFYKRKYMEEAHEFYMKHGGVAIVGARFVPVMRTFVPFAAGVAKMPYTSFVFWNILGGFLWITSLLWGGYFLGGTALGKHLDRIILVVVAVSVLPLVIGFVKRFLQGRKAA